MILSRGGSVKQVKEACDYAAQAENIADLKGYLNKHSNLKYSELEDKGLQKLLIYSPKSFGRYTCTVEFSNEKIIKSEYLFLD